MIHHKTVKSHFRHPETGAGKEAKGEEYEHGKRFRNYQKSMVG